MDAATLTLYLSSRRPVEVGVKSIDTTLDLRSPLLICTPPLTYWFEPRRVPGVVRLEINPVSMHAFKAVWFRYWEHFAFLVEKSPSLQLSEHISGRVAFYHALMEFHCQQASGCGVPCWTSQAAFEDCLEYGGTPECVSWELVMCKQLKVIKNWNSFWNGLDEGLSIYLICC